MNYKMIFPFIVFLFVAGKIWGQNLYLNPASIPLGNLNQPISVSLAGSCPLNPLSNYTSQTIKYKWSFLGDGVFSNIYVYSSSIPSGFTVTVQASSTSSPSSYSPGSSTGTVTVSSSYQSIVSGIYSTSRWLFGSAQTITRTLTQNITISDFSQLHPGTYDITIEYSLQ